MGGCSDSCEDVWLVAWVDASDPACETNEWVRSRCNASTEPA
uniref:Uncharacterized protein n=1 Tax=Arundo donax TaxID=35708 RepID=A0A0A9FNU7_ARUDO